MNKKRGGCLSVILIVAASFFCIPFILVFGWIPGIIWFLFFRKRMNNNPSKQKNYTISIAIVSAVSFFSMLWIMHSGSGAEAVMEEAENRAEADSETEADMETESESEMTVKENTGNQSPEIRLSEETKQAIIEADSAVWNEILSLDAAYDDFASAIDLFNENYDTVAFNRAAEEMTSIAKACGAAIDTVEYEGMDNYLLEAGLYAELLQYIGEDIQKYFETSNEFYINEATEFVEKRTSHVLSVVSERMKFLSAAGLSDQEVGDLMSSGSEAPDTEITSSELSVLPEMSSLPQQNTDAPSDTPQENTDSNPSDNAQDSVPSAYSADAGNGDSGNNFNTYDNAGQQQTSASYVLNTGTMKIHYPSCGSVPKIAPHNYAESSQSLEELQAQGYTTCGNCF